MQSSYEQSWADFKKKIRAAIIFFSVVLPTGFLVAYVLVYFTPFERPRALIGVAVVWGIVFAWLGVRVSNLCCPGCGKLFFGDGGGDQDVRGSAAKVSPKRIMRASVGRVCRSCGLKLYAQPLSDSPIGL